MSRNQYLKRILVAPLGDKVVLVAIIERFSGARPSTTLAESACTGVLWICFLQCGHCSGGGKVTGGNAQPTSRRFDFTNDCAVQLMGRSLCARLVLNKGRPQLNSGSDFRRCNQPMPRHQASKGGARTDDIMRHQSIGPRLAANLSGVDIGVGHPFAGRACLSHHNRVVHFVLGLDLDDQLLCLGLDQKIRLVGLAARIVDLN
jgi:hypothetical protein